MAGFVKRRSAKAEESGNFKKYGIKPGRLLKKGRAAAAVWANKKFCHLARLVWAAAMGIPKTKVQSLRISLKSFAEKAAGRVIVKQGCARL